MKTPESVQTISLYRFVPYLLVAAGLAVYANGLSSPFIYDDIPSIVENRDIRQLWPPHWAAPSSQVHAAVNSRPVVSFSFALNYALGGLEVGGYHLFNLAVHILCALVLFGIVRRTLQSQQLQARFGAAADGLAAVCALLWLLHPLQSQCVNYVTQRSEALMGLFYLLTLYASMRASTNPYRWYAVAILCCALGMASKEAMVTAPLLVLLYDRVFCFTSYAEAWCRRRSLYLGLAATWLLLALLLWSAPHGETIGFTSKVTVWDYALNQCIALIAYIKLAFWPHPLVLDYGPPLIDLSLNRVAPSALLLLTLLALTAMALYRRPMLGFLGAWFFLILGPTSSFVPIVNEGSAERRVYLSLAGLIVLVVIAGHMLLQRLGRRDRGSAKWLIPFLVLLVAAGLGYRTSLRNEDFYRELSIWHQTVEVVPQNPRAHHNLAHALQNSGRTAAAIKHYRIALGLKPDYADAHNNLANALKAGGDLQAAIVHYHKALAIHPDFAVAHNNLANALKASGDLQTAIVHYHKALQINRDYADAHNNLANALALTGNLEEAILYYQNALKLQPNFVKAHYNLGAILQTRGELERAIDHYRQALRWQPDFAAARQNLDIALAALRGAKSNK